MDGHLQEGDLGITHWIGGNRKQIFLTNFCFRMPKTTFSITKIDIMAIENV